MTITISKKVIIITSIVLAIIVITAVALILGGNKNAIQFSNLEDAEIPTQIVTQVLPEYQALERALALVVDDKVYVIATRGEKQTSGYDIQIDKMEVVKEDDRTTLLVYTTFTDPQPDTVQSKVLSYPLQVAETDLTYLPDQVELKVSYPNSASTVSTSTDDNKPTDAATFFQETRATIDKDRNEVISMLDAVISESKEGSTEKANAIYQKQKIIDTMALEKELENQIKQVGFSEVLVLITDSNVNITVDKKKITPDEMNTISNIVITETGRGAEQIIIQSL